MAVRQYAKKDGSKAWLFNAYLGLDPLNGKEVKTTRRGFSSKREAEMAEKRLLVEVEKNGYKKAPKLIKFQDVYEDWKHIYKNTVKESTYVIQLNAADKHILPLFGDIYVSKLTIKFCQDQLNYWYSYYKKYSNLLGITRSILDYAQTLEYIEDNPMRKVILPKRKLKPDEEKYTSPFYDAKQLKHFFECLATLNNDQEYIMFRILAYTGLRKSELLALRWTDIDFTNKTLTVNRTLAKGIDNTTIIQTPKTYESKREISLDKTTIKLLKKWQVKQRELMLKAGYNTSGPKQYVITNRYNVHQYVDYPNNRLKYLLRIFDLPKITVHGFRHTHCSLLFEAGATVKAVQDRLGHTDIRTTMDIYNHLTGNQKENTAEQFAAFMNF